MQAQDIAGLQSGIDIVPKILNSTVSATLDLNPRFSNILKYNQTTATASNTLYTTPRDKDFYLTHAVLSFVKSALSDMASVSINAVVSGATIRIITKELSSLAVENDTVIITFSYPIKIDRNTGITLAGSFAAGTCTKTGMIGGFIIE